MIPKSFEAISKTDIDALINIGEPEGRTIEYKEVLPSGKDEDRKEFLADVSSFANASGGHLLFGIVEKRVGGKPSGIPEVAPGLNGINPDEEIRKLEDLLRSSVAPRMPGIRIRAVNGFADGPVLLLEIPKSWASPHMVTFRGTSRFYSRTSAGKHQLDVSEIRAAFLASESVAEKTSQFRTDRIAKILAGETPVPLKREPTVVLHIIPLAAFASPAALDLASHARLSSSDFHVMYGQTPSHRHFNFDGLIAYDELFGRTGEPTSCSYLQIFRNGAIEAASTELIAQDHGFYPNFVEGRVIEAVSKYLALLANFGLLFPVFIAVSVVFVKGQTPKSGKNGWNVQFAKPIDRDVLIVSPIGFEETPTDIPLALKPAFDAIWQAGGWPHSPYYDDAGKRRPLDF